MSTTNKSSIDTTSKHELDNALFFNEQLVTQQVLTALVEDLSDNILDTSAANIQAILNNLTNNGEQGQLLEVLAKQDITASLIAAEDKAHAHIITREDITLCGRQWAHNAFMLIDPSLELDWHYKDGDRIQANASLLHITGNARAILTAERTALNFLQMLSATATVTAFYVESLAGTNTALLDTRKTIPSFRQAQKYAVKCGGGQNHRMGLFDAFLIKENHIKACGSIKNAISKAKELHCEKIVEIEVESIAELEEAIAAGADIVMLDNFSTQLIQEAVSINNHRCKLEVSGNITQERLAELANTRVNFISSGAITKNVQAVDLSLLIL